MMLPAKSEMKVPARVVKALKLEFNAACDRVTGVKVIGEISAEERSAAIQALQAREAERLPVDTIKDALGRIKLMTTGKNITQADLVAQINTFAQALSEQPAYAVQSVLWDWPKANQWFPTYAQLTTAIDDACSKYRQTLKALESHEPAAKRYGHATKAERLQMARRIGELIKTMPESKYG